MSLNIYLLNIIPYCFIQFLRKLSQGLRTFNQKQKNQRKSDRNQMDVCLT